MKKLPIVGLISATIVGVASFSIAGQKINDKELLNQARNYFQPLPKQIQAPSDNPTTKEKVELGKKLYYDPRLSLSGVISCNTCHNLATYGVDGV
jgi:cytochrome c peroxidase